MNFLIVENLVDVIDASTKYTWHFLFVWMTFSLSRVESLVDAINASTYFSTKYTCDFLCIWMNFVL